jgi:acetylornithine deacetylase
MSVASELLARLIRQRTDNGPSPCAGDEGAMVQLLDDLLREKKPDEIGRGSVDGHHWIWARWGAPRLLVNAHIDTVPANAGWMTDPWTPVERDGKLYGLGACDTKGAIAAILTAIRAPKDTLILFSGDEEATGRVMNAWLATERQLFPGIERAIVCEPTSCRAGTRHRGILAMTARLRGEGGHSSMADRMPAPIVELARLAVSWHDWGVARRAAGPTGFEGMCLNVAKLDGGVAFNVVPEAASLNLSLRPPPGADNRALAAELTALAAPIPVEIDLDNPAFATRDLPGFEPLLGKLEETDLAFWTEAALLARAGIDCVVYGPGDIAHAHAANERVPLADLERARETFERFL